MRALLVGILALLVFAAAAVAPPSLQAAGENMELVANHPIEEGRGTDLELAGDYAYVAYFGGFVIVDISDPRKPKRVGTLECGGGGHDIALSPDATIAYFAADNPLGECGEGSGTAIVDVSDKTRPQVLSAVVTSVGSHTVTTDGHVLSSNNYASDEVLLFDVSDPRNPKPLAQTATPGPSAFHDSFFDHRPDGKVLLYGASGEGHDVFDVTDPAKPTHLQRVVDPEVSFSHQLEPNYKRDILIVSDEWGGGGTAGACGKNPAADPTGPVPGPGTANDLGAIHFYRAGTDGRFATEGLAKLGTFNLPFEAPQTAGCTSHVFWQAPDANRFSIAWYVHGTRVVDFSNPAAPQEIGWFVPDRANTWSAKPHRGYIFTGDLNRGMDVLQFTGDGWPKDAPPADLQRLAQNGFYKPPATGPGPSTTGPPPPVTRPPAADRRVGRFAFRKRLRVPGRRGKRVRLTVSFIDGGQAVVGRARVRKPVARRASLRASGVAEAGAYRYVVRLGRRVLGRGRFTVRPASGVKLAANRVITARVR